MPVPPENGLVSESEDGERVEIDLRRPLEEFRLAASHLMGKEFADPEDAYSDTHWQPRLLDVDLTWTTDGIPYHYDLTTRYEIPCLVTGTVTIDGETLHRRRAGPAGPLLGRAGLVGLWMVLVLHAPR